MKKRIYTNECGVDCIDLTTTERQKVRDVGFKIALFKNDTLAKVFDPLAVEIECNELEETLDKIAQQALDFIKQDEGEYFAVEYSGGMFCCPRKIHLGDTGSYAYTMRRIGDSMAEIF